MIYSLSQIWETTNTEFCSESIHLIDKEGEDSSIALYVWDVGFADRIRSGCCRGVRKVGLSGFMAPGSFCSRCVSVEAKAYT
jgi:hypothetical protein